MPSRPGSNHIPQRTIGSPQYLGSIVTTSTSAANNSNTAAPFSNISGKVLLIQPNAACYILAQTTSAGAVTAANGVKLAADERIVLTLLESESFLSVLRESADVTLKVWSLE